MERIENISTLRVKAESLSMLLCQQNVFPWFELVHYSATQAIVPQEEEAMDNGASISFGRNAALAVS